MSDADSAHRSLTGSALLERLRQQMAARLQGQAELFRVVEIARDGRGRLVPQGQIWHSDLDHVRRFGRAVAANSVSQKIVIADSAGTVVEDIPLAPADAAPAGWGGWKDVALPPAPPRKRPKPPAARARPGPAPAAAAAAVPAQAPAPAAETGLGSSVETSVDSAADVESTATLPPGSVPPRPQEPAPEPLPTLLP